MSGKQVSVGEGVGSIDPIEAYKILLQHQINNDRLLTERTTIYLVASSILFLAFVMLSQSSVTLAPVSVKLLRIVLSLAGVFLTVLLYSFNRATHNILEFLWRAQENIERTQEFAYMKENNIAPQIDGWEFTNGKKRWDNNKTTVVNAKWWRKPLLFRYISCVCLPLTFILIWISSLFAAIFS